MRTYINFVLLILNGWDSRKLYGTIMEYWDCYFNKVTRKKAINIKQVSTAILTLENSTLSGDLLVPCSIAHI